MPDEDQITVTLSRWSADDLVKRVAHQLSEDTLEAIGQKVEELLGESIDVLVQAKLGEYLEKNVETLVSEHYIPVTEEGVTGESSTLDDYVRNAIAGYVFEPCKVETRRDKRSIVPNTSSYDRAEGTRFELLVGEMAREAATDLVTKEIAQHTTKMKEDATEAVKQLVAEHIVTASEKRQLNGGLPR